MRVSFWVSKTNVWNHYKIYSPSSPQSSSASSSSVSVDLDFPKFFNFFRFAAARLRAVKKKFTNINYNDDDVWESFVLENILETLTCALRKLFLLLYIFSSTNTLIKMWVLYVLYMKAWWRGKEKSPKMFTMLLLSFSMRHRFAFSFFTLVH